jgi:hypothetical protein
MFFAKQRIPQPFQYVNPLLLSATRVSLMEDIVLLYLHGKVGF